MRITEQPIKTGSYSRAGYTIRCDDGKTYNLKQWATASARVTGLSPETMRYRFRTLHWDDPGLMAPSQALKKRVWDADESIPQGDLAALSDEPRDYNLLRIKPFSRFEREVMGARL